MKDEKDSNNHVFVRLKSLPRPDHPTEDRPIELRANLIECVLLEPFNYTPDGQAPVALLPNNKSLKGMATCVATVTGKMFFVEGSMEEVMEKIRVAYASGRQTQPLGVAA